MPAPPGKDAGSKVWSATSRSEDAAGTADEAQHRWNGDRREIVAAELRKR